MTDEMLRQAARNASRMFVEALEEDYDPRSDYPPSPAFRRKLRSLRRRAEHPYAHAALQRAAVFVLVLLLSGGAFLSVDAQARDALQVWLREIGENFVLYRFTEDDASADFPCYRLGWVPEGFTMTAEHDLSDVEMYIVHYADPETGLGFRFDYQHMTENAITWIDSTEYTHEYVTVNDLPGEFYESIQENEASNLLWFDQERNLIFGINSRLDRETIFQIAECVELAETP